MCFQIVSYYRSSCVFRLSPTIKTAFSTLENAVFDQVKALVSSSFVRLYSQFLPKRILKSSQNPSKNGLLSLKICPYSKFTATYQVTATIINPLIYKKKNALVAALEQIIRNSSCALNPSSDSSPVGLWPLRPFHDSSSNAKVHIIYETTRHLRNFSPFLLLFRDFVLSLQLKAAKLLTLGNRCKHHCTRLIAVLHT